MKKILFTLIVFFIGINISYGEKITVELAKNSKSAILMDAESKTILYEKNADEPMPPASMTKIMSMLLIMEAIDSGKISLDSEVTISKNASDMGGSQIFLQQGEKYTVNELLKGIAIASGNDAVVAMAEYISGSVEQFVSDMNEKAKSLGLENTQFQNPHGLDTEGHYSSAKDMAIMAQELLNHPKILEYTSIYEDYLNKKDGSNIWLVNTNKLVRFYDGVDGLKTGYTESAGYCLTATAKKGNTRFIAVSMGSDSSEARNSDISSMLNYGFSNYESYVILSKNDLLGKKRSELTEEEYVGIVLKKDYIKLLKKGTEKPNYYYSLKIDSLNGELKSQDTLGYADVIDEQGNTVDTLEVTVDKNYRKASFLQLWGRNLKRFTTGKIRLK